VTHRDVRVADRLAGSGRVPGALLLTGSSEAEVRREAGDLAASLLCPGDDPERRCDACRRASAGLHPDLFVLAPEGLQIRVDRVREAITFAAGRPYESARRVAIVDRADQLGAEAANALLKTLEEPGAHFHWILTTTRPETLLPTIRSRCAVARVPPAPPGDRVDRWRRRGFAETDMPDLERLEREEVEATAEDLAQFRQLRSEILEALDGGLRSGNLPALVLLAEALSRPDAAAGARMLAELLADAAQTGAVSPDLLRHRDVGGAVAMLSRTAAREAFARAALKAVDPPADSRRGNRRLHFESLLLELFLARTRP
jgi:DNA polymerase-3 subunit delta'